MKNKITKTEILKACIEKQEELIESFKQRETEMQNDAFSQTESDSQSEDRQADKIDVLNALGNELTFAQQELFFLNSLNADTESTVVEPGAVVVTEEITFFIGVSSEKVEVSGEEFFGISTKAPIYANMKGLENGSKFQYNETKYMIKDIY